MIDIMRWHILPAAKSLNYVNSSDNTQQIICIGFAITSKLGFN